MSATVTAICTTPVKGLALHSRPGVTLGRAGVRDDRLFYIVDARQRMVNNKRFGVLMTVRADVSELSDPLTLTLSFPDGHTLSEVVQDGPVIETTFFSREDRVARVCPQLSVALSNFAGAELSLVRADATLTASDRGRTGVVSLYARASLARLSQEAGEPVDPRRLRMLFEVEGLGAHAEDAWAGERVRIGSALVRFHGHVGRCRVTQMNPDTGVVNLPTLDLLDYRRGLPTSEPLALGLYGEVLEPGTVTIGDPVTPAP